MAMLILDKVGYLVNKIFSTYIKQKCAKQKGKIDKLTKYLEISAMLFK